MAALMATFTLVDERDLSLVRNLGRLGQVIDEKEDLWAHLAREAAKPINVPAFLAEKLIEDLPTSSGSGSSYCLEDTYLEIRKSTIEIIELLGLYIEATPGVKEAYINGISKLPIPPVDEKRMINVIAKYVVVRVVHYEETCRFG